MTEREEIAALLMAGLDWAADHLRASLEDPLGSQCVTTFASVLEYDLANGSIAFSELQQLHRDQISPADVGLGLINGVIGTIRMKMAGEAPNADVERIVEGLERAAEMHP